METKGHFTEEELAVVLGSRTRWKMLRELSKGGLFSVAELGKTAGVSGAAASKHMVLMARAGIVAQGKGRLYALAPGVLAEGEGRVLRLGICTLDFG